MGGFVMSGIVGQMFIYRGLPGSGKTYQARLNAFQDKGRLVGRDHVRQLMNVEGIGTPAQEAEVTRIQEQLIISGLRSGQHVHVDDMNLKADYVRRLVNIAWREGAEWKIIDLTNQDVEVCHVRNVMRDRVVPSEVIDRNYERFIKGKPYPLPFQFTGARVEDTYQGEPYTPDLSLREAVLIDVDGTVADHEGIRGHHEYDKVHLDKPKPEVIRVVKTLVNTGVRPLYVSGRPESCMEATWRWLSTHATEPFDIIMRKTGDRRADYIVKRELFDKHIRYNYNVIGAFDDRNQVVDMYRSLGITVFQVAEGNF
jgi:predicted kinase